MRARIAQTHERGSPGRRRLVTADAVDAQLARAVPRAQGAEGPGGLPRRRCSRRPIDAGRRLSARARRGARCREGRIVALCDVSDAPRRRRRDGTRRRPRREGALSLRPTKVDCVILEPADDTAIMAVLARLQQRALRTGRGGPALPRRDDRRRVAVALRRPDERRDPRPRRAADRAIARRTCAPRSPSGSCSVVYEQIELPLVMVLGRMEARGIRVDVDLLRTHRRGVRGRRPRRSTGQIQKVAGHEFKVNSPQQLQTVLFDELGLTHGKKIEVRATRPTPASLEAIRGRAHDRRPDPALPRGRQAARHLRGAADRRGPARRAHPRDVSPDRRAHRPALLGEPEPPQHPRTLAPKDDASATPSCRPRAGCWRSRTTTRSNCASSRTSPRTRDCSRPSPRTRTCTALIAASVFGVDARRGHDTSSASGRRPSPTASPTGWRPSGSAGDSG